MKKLLIAAVILILVAWTNHSCVQKAESAVGAARSYENVDEMVSDAKARITEIPLEDFKKLYDDMEPFVLIDVRTVAEHEAGYIPGSVSMPRGVLEFRIASEKAWDNEGMYVPLKDDHLIIYCKKGNRSSLATESLLRLGYTNVSSLEGGFVNWRAHFPETVDKDIDEEASSGPIVTSTDSGGGC